jgi:hypothetical protein
MSGIDRLIDEVVYLRLEVEKLRTLIGAQAEEIAGLQIMQATWPTRCPDDPPPVRH